MIGPINVGPTFEDEKTYGGWAMLLSPGRRHRIEWGLQPFHVRRRTMFLNIDSRPSMWGAARYTVRP